MPKESGSNRGRPVTHTEPWSKITVVILDRQVAMLDRLAIDIRLKSGVAISRAEIIRGILDGVVDSLVDLTGCTTVAEITREVAGAVSGTRTKMRRTG